MEKHILFDVVGMIVFLFSFPKNANLQICYSSVNFFFYITKTAFDITIVNGMHNCKRMVYHFLNNGTKYLSRSKLKGVCMLYYSLYCSFQLIEIFSEVLNISLTVIANAVQKPTLGMTHWKRTRCYFSLCQWIQFCF